MFGYRCKGGLARDFGTKIVAVHLGPAVPLHSVLVVGSASLEDWLVNPSTSSNTSNHGTVGRGDNLDSDDEYTKRGRILSFFYLL